MTESLLYGGPGHAPTTQRDEATAPPVHRSPGAARSLLDVFAETVGRCRTRVAIDAPDSVLSYAELFDAVRVLADRLCKLGIGPGDRVGVYVPSGTAELYVAILGTLHAGAAYVPVDADDPPARASAIWKSSGVCAVIEAGLEITKRAEPGGALRALTVDDDAWVIFTSGSSGTPKGVAVTHRSAAAFVDAEAGLWRMSPEDRVLAGLSVGFDASCEEIWLAWRHGAALVPAPRSLVRAASDLGPWLAERRVSVISTVPTLAAMWDESDLAGVRLLILGGEACPEGLAWRLAEQHELWNTYGPTEATVVTTAARLHPGKPVTIGWPLAGWSVAIVDELGAPVALGESGELVIGGVGLGRYIDPALDAERYAPLPALGWNRAYRTGDIVRETIDGLEFAGRRDDQVKLGGRRLELGEIDAQLRAVAGVRAASAAVQKTDAGNQVLVGYVVGEVDPTEARRVLAEQLPEGIVPLIVPLDTLPTAASGKVNRKALPWPPPPGSASSPTDDAEPLSPTAAWLRDKWADQLGPLPLTAASDFFELGGSSLAVAKLVSTLRARFPSVAVADVYAHRRLGELADRLDSLAVAARPTNTIEIRGRRRWTLVQLAALLVLVLASSPQWVISILAVDRLTGGHLDPTVGWGWLVAGWAVFGTAIGRAALVVLARRALLARLEPGRYPRRSWLMCRLWFVERLAEAFRSDRLAGTPFGTVVARLCGHDVGAGARLGTLPPITSLLSIGEGATIEPEVDAHGWWLEGDEVVIDEVRIGAGARVGTRTLLGPGAEIGAGAEVEPGSAVTGSVPAGERWAGSPARRIGHAGEEWPRDPAPLPRAPRFWKAMYGAGVIALSLLPLAAALPGLLLLLLSGADNSDQGIVIRLVVEAPLIAASFLLSCGLLVALAVRLVGRLLRPGWHPDDGATRWALWFSEALMQASRGALFSVYMSLYIRPWLLLAGIRVGKRTEVSTVVGMNRLASFRELSFAADDVAFAPARFRGGWIHLSEIEIGRATFIGNGAVVRGDTKLGSNGTIGVYTTAPRTTPDGTSWFGAPAFELPRIPECADASRTVNPPRRLILARGAVEVVRMLLPVTVSIVLGGLMFGVLQAVAHAYGIGTMALATGPVMFAGGLGAVAFTVAAKWIIIGRYRPGKHPLWSFFVWRDEIMNSLIEHLAGPWLVNASLGTPLMSVYLRAMGAKVGREVWFDSLDTTEFDVIEVGDGAVVNRFCCVQTHLFHDRLMRIGPAKLGAGSTLGPASIVLPDTLIGAGTMVGGRSVVLRGEELPSGTRWHGAPVVSA